MDYLIMILSDIFMIELVFGGSLESQMKYQIVQIYGFLRERLKDNDSLDLIWAELQCQLDNMGYEIIRGVMQDATFITADPGHAKANKPRGEEVQTRRSKEGTWSKKGNRSFFGFKMYTLVDKEHQFIRSVTTSTASLHDGQVDLSEQGQTVYRDRGYFGVETKASMDKTMDRATKTIH
jgi:transposase, IS5 family